MFAENLIYNELVTNDNARKKILSSYKDVEI